jgi:hypothetical protein
MVSPILRYVFALRRLSEPVTTLQPLGLRGALLSCAERVSLVYERATRRIEAVGDALGESFVVGE